MKPKAKLFRGLSAVFCMLLCIVVCLTVLAFENPGAVNNALGIKVSAEIGNGEIYYKTDYTDDGLPSDEGLVKLQEAAREFNIRAQGEGSVLLKNNGVLPFGNDVKQITLFGRAVADPVYNAALPLAESQKIDLYSALTSEGFSINETLYNAYAASSTKRLLGNDSTANIGEESQSFYTATLRDSFDNYKDAAVVMFAREAGEGNDLSMKDSDGLSQLALHQSEADLLKMIQTEGFDKVVVIINSAYPMELGWVDQEEYGVDACLWIGTPGTYGFGGVAKILTGEYNPSGKLVDTYAADSFSSASMVNAGDFTFENSNNKYLIYAEGIYVGYKYYETRYEDLILGRYNADNTAGATDGGAWNYSEEVCYPFGFGLSYTTFNQTLDSVEWSRESKTVTAKVTVTNTGNKEGKSVIQLYAQTPYTDYDRENLVEKSAVQLLDYAKTDLLKPGESKTYTIEADEYLLASYDANAVKGYILDAGDYFFAIGDDVHDALNNILAAKNASGMYSHDGKSVVGNADNVFMENIAEMDSTTYRHSANGTEVTNQFDSDIYAVDYNYYNKGAIQYLTRQDWTTYPQSYTGLTETEDMQYIHGNSFYEDIIPDNAPAYSSFTQGEDAGVDFIDMRNVDYDDEEAWNKFLNQLSISELAAGCNDSYSNRRVDAVNKPTSNHNDSPDALSTTYQYGNKENSTSYVCASVIAATWNKDIASEKGNLIAEDAIYCKINFNWGPGSNMHRNIFCGRNNIYFSEDATVSYFTTLLETKAMTERGLVTGIKHFVANDQETNRNGVSTFMTEQTLREIYLRAFEGAITKGNANGIMSSYNALGSCYTAVNAALLTQVLRNEWGFKGLAITDAGSCSDVPILALSAGTDMFCFQSQISKTISQAVRNDGFALQNLRNANKHMYYAFSQSTLANGLVSGQAAVESGVWWEPAIICINVVLGVVAIGFAGLFVYVEFFRKNKKLKGDV